MHAVTLRILIVLLLCLGACGRAPQQPGEVSQPAEARRVEPQYAYAQTNDLRVAPQLISGWHPVEDGAWRWMSREAQAVLRAPENSPAEFEVRLAFPKGHVAITGPVTFSVLFNDKPFAEQTYTADGNYSLTKTLPAGLLTREPVRVTLRVSKPRPAGTGGDLRELGAVILGLGFK